MHRAVARGAGGGGARPAGGAAVTVTISSPRRGARIKRCKQGVTRPYVLLFARMRGVSCVLHTTKGLTIGTRTSTHGAPRASAAASIYYDPHSHPLRGAAPHVIAD